MKRIHSKRATIIPVALLALLSTLNSQLSTLLAQGTAFTYQGRLTVGGNPANGIYDFRCRLSEDSAGTVYDDGTLLLSAQPVSNGLFTVALDFGANFPGADRWLEIGVRTNGAASYTTLSPRQKLTPTPYAMTAGNLSGALPASQLTGALSSAQLVGAYSGGVTLNNAANSFSGNGAGLTSLNANNLSSGTVADARLSANAALLNRNPQTFTGQNIFKQGSGSGLTAPSAALVADAQTTADGIWGASGVANGVGIFGECDNGSFASGVYGKSSGSGVSGEGGTYGVFGSGSSYGGYFTSASTGLYASGNPAIYASGNVGIGTSSPAAPLHVKQGSGSGVTPDSAAIVGDAQSSFAGIWGASGSVNGNGVVGECDNGSFAAGLYGTSSTGYGVYGYGGRYGVYGSGNIYGVYGSGSSYGVYGVGNTYGGAFYSGGTTGLYATSTAAAGNGLVGVCDNGLGACGVRGGSVNGYGVIGSGGAYGLSGSGGIGGVYGHGIGSGTGGFFESGSGAALHAEGSPAIETSGSVGINTTPDATLHVLGTTTRQAIIRPTFIILISARITATSIGERPEIGTSAPPQTTAA